MKEKEWKRKFGASKGAGGSEVVGER